MPDNLTAQQFDESPGVQDWRAFWGAGWAGAHFQTGTFETGVALVQAIGRLAAAAGRRQRAAVHW
jgi:4a-hydroxytetrahydrobiopterin dehydratase